MRLLVTEVRSLILDEMSIQVFMFTNQNLTNAKDYSLVMVIIANVKGKR
jgi:hypothetical protein